MTHISRTTLARTFLLACASFCLLSLLIDYSQLQVWQHDSAIYGLNGHFDKIFTEGRWLNPYLAIFFSKINGQFSVLICLASLFFFFLRVSQSYLNDVTYSIIFSFLCLQAIPLAYQLMWPAILAPICIVLMVSALVSRALPTYLFYPLFGIIFFATISSFYYLLPLTQLYLLKSHRAPLEGLKVLIIRIAPYWVLGFLIGYLSMKLAVYIFSYQTFGEGTFEIKIGAWREPNPIESIDDIFLNIKKSARYLISHLMLLFESPITIAAAITTLLVRYRCGRLVTSMPTFILCSSIVAAHYVLIIPFGIIFEVRTALATWVGMLFIVFLIDRIETQAKTLIMLMMVIFSFAFYQQNNMVLSTYSTITDTYYHDLVESVGQPAAEYDGILLLEDKPTFTHLNLRILRENGLKKTRNSSWSNNVFRWAPVAYQAGYKSVKLCLYRHSSDPNCIDALEKFGERRKASNTTGITIVEGTLNNYLVIRFNRDAKLSYVESDKPSK